MRLLIIVLLGLITAVCIGMLLSRDTGLMILSYAGYNVQMSFSLFVVLLLTALFAFYFLFRFVAGILHLPRSISRWAKHRRHRRSEKYLSRGILAVLEGDWKTAEQSFRRGAEYSRLPLVNYLAAARAAQHLDADARRDNYLRLAHENSGDAGLAIGLTQARLQLNRGQTEEAYATLQQLAGEFGAEEQVKNLLLEAATALKEWPQALQLMKDPKLKKSLPRTQVEVRQAEIYAGLLRASPDLGALESEWEKIPGKFRDQAGLLQAYVNMRLQFGDDTGCEALLRRALKLAWEPGLARLYGLVTAADVSRQIKFAERLLAKYPGQPALLLTLGRLCRRQRLWGKAKTYLEESAKSAGDVEACQELALLLQQQGEHEAAAVYFQKGLALATGSAPDTQGLLLQGPDKDPAEVARKVV